MKITSIVFKNFKAFSNYSVSLDKLNILVGANNSGKSTIISALRALSSGIRKARSRNPEFINGPTGQCLGYRLESSTLPISVENVHTDYNETDTTVDFRLENGSKLILFFPPESGCFLIAESIVKTPRTPAEFKRIFPLSIGIVPILGPVEHREEIVRIETVRRELETHRASRHFRNYWMYYPEYFEEFANLIRRTWPGMEINKPEQVNVMNNELVMFCYENRILRELYWSGFGFQVWCQMLTHITRSSNSDVMVIDEPDIYLHPDVQRQLINLLRDINADVILATHSTEIMSEADPLEILVIDKSKKSAKRLKDIEGVQEALNKIGSIQNITLTQLAKNRRILFVEGMDDFKRIRRFAKKMGLNELSNGSGLTPFESGGFSSWEKIKSTAWGFEQTLAGRLKIAAVFDRDYWCDEEISYILDELNKKIELSHVHLRKEMENYLLLPRILQRAVDMTVAAQKKRTTSKSSLNIDISAMIDEVTQKYKNSCLAQYSSKRVDYLKDKTKLDTSTLNQQSIDLFEAKWEKLESRIEIVPGKEVLRELRTILQEKYKVNLSDYRIIDAFHKEEIPHDLISLLNGLESYRSQ